MRMYTFIYDLWPIAYERHQHAVSIIGNNYYRFIDSTFAEYDMKLYRSKASFSKNSKFQNGLGACLFFIFTGSISSVRYRREPVFIKYRPRLGLAWCTKCTTDLLPNNYQYYNIKADDFKTRRSLKKIMFKLHV